MVNTVGGCYHCPHCGLGIHDAVYRPPEILHYTGLSPTVEKVYDAVNNPSHYCEGRKFEPADVAEDWGLDKDAYLFNVFTYIARAGRKDDILQDLEKARWYLDRRIKCLKGERE